MSLMPVRGRLVIVFRAAAPVSIVGHRLWLATVGLVLAGLFMSGPSLMASSLSPSPSQPPDANFPSIVAGLPVLSVADAVEQLGAGQLDGQAVAVAGYYDEIEPSCPYPGRY